jgi:hypothetical protein
VRRELEKFELVQIWISDDKIGPLAREQFRRMKRVFATTSIPLHVVLDPRDPAHPDGRPLVRFTYDPTMSAEDYLAFLRKGLAKYGKR